MQHNIFCVRESIKTESATAVQRAFRLRFNIQPSTFKLHCGYNQMEFTSYLSLVLILKYRLTKLSPSFLITLYYNLMGPPSYMRSVVDRNFVMRRIPEFETESNTDHNFIKVFSSAMR